MVFFYLDLFAERQFMILCFERETGEIIVRFSMSVRFCALVCELVAICFITVY